MQKQSKPRRNSESTKVLILNGLEAIIKRDGFTAVGINAVAREAGVDKVLIYRYFDSMEGLLEAFALRVNFWPDIQQVYKEMPENSTVSEILFNIVLSFSKTVQENKLIQELLRWELSETNPLTDCFFKKRIESELNAFAEEGILPEENVVIFATVIISGLQFLSLRGKKTLSFLGFDYSEPEVVKKIEEVIRMAIEGFVRISENGESE